MFSKNFPKLRLQLNFTHHPTTELSPYTRAPSRTPHPHEKPGDRGPHTRARSVSHRSSPLGLSLFVGGHGFFLAARDPLVQQIFAPRGRQQQSSAHEVRNALNKANHAARSRGRDFYMYAMPCTGALASSSTCARREIYMRAREGKKRATMSAFCARNRRWEKPSRRAPGNYDPRCIRPGRNYRNCARPRFSTLLPFAAPVLTGAREWRGGTRQWEKVVIGHCGLQIDLEIVEFGSRFAMSGVWFWSLVGLN